MRTKAIIEYGAVDITAKEDSTITVDNSQEFSKLYELKKNTPVERKYSTLEKNFFVLNGEAENIGTAVREVGWWSTRMSDADGSFDTPITMTIDFTSNHSTIGLTLTFSKYAYCNHLKIQYYNASNTLITEQTYYPDSYDYFCEGTAANYRKIVITFYSTNIPYRYLKMYRVLFGRAVVFEGDSLVSANILEQVDLLSNELSINTLDFVVYSDDDRFNILNPQGIYAGLQEMQQLNVYKVVDDDEPVSMGTFYLKNWKSQNDNKMELEGIDLVGLLDGETFYGGMYTNVTASSLISSIMSTAGISQDYYLVADDVKNLTLTGYIPVCTPREALQQVLFTLGAVANCSRSDIINIYKVSNDTPSEITRDRVLKGSEEIEKGEIVTGVLVKAHNYKMSVFSPERTLFDGRLTTGTYKIVFEYIVYSLSAENATITTSNANYCVITVSGTQDVKITGFEYKDNTQDIYVENSIYSGSDSKNVVNVESVYLINNSNAQDIANRLINYYSNRFVSSFNYILDDEKVGDYVTLGENFNNSLNGNIIELDIDLTGGFIASTKIDAKVGVNQ